MRSGARSQSRSSAYADGCGQGQADPGPSLAPLPPHPAFSDTSPNSPASRWAKEEAAGPGVVVVGSLNLDVVVPVARHPAPGETVLGGDSARYPGGKGANQAVGAARLGQEVAMVGRVGDDESGQTLLAALRADGVDTRFVAIDARSPSGLALITVSADGENSIVVSPGANARLREGDVRAAAPMLGAAGVTLLQLEVPLEAVMTAARLAGGAVILNPAPAPDNPLPGELLEAVDVVVPNRSELARLADAPPPASPEEALRLVRQLDTHSAMVVTLGAQGALVVEGESVTLVTAPAATPVDTTAAGDAFCSGLADALARGAELVQAARWATQVAAITVTRRGAQTSLPRRIEVEEFGAWR